MALIGRLFVIFFAFLAACLVAGMIVVFALLFPDLSDLVDYAFRGDLTDDPVRLPFVVRTNLPFELRDVVTSALDLGADTFELHLVLAAHR